MSRACNFDTQFEDEFLERVVAERDRQDAKWGVQNHTPFKWVSILTEEVGEIAKAAYEQKSDEYAAELVQTAAVCMAMYENLKQRNEAEFMTGTT